MVCRARKKNSQYFPHFLLFTYSTFFMAALKFLKGALIIYHFLC